MKTSIVKIGNSQGIRIPKAILKSSKLDTEVILRLKKNGSIEILPSPSTKGEFNDEYLMSLPVLDDWNTPEEDAAWAHLQ